MNDLAVVADTVERVLIDKDSSCLDDDDIRWRLEVAVERLATAGVKWHEIGQVENAAIAGWTRAVPWPLDREEDEISKRW